jgi:hypothetical protein
MHPDADEVADLVGQAANAGFRRLVVSLAASQLVLWLLGAGSPSSGGRVRRRHSACSTVLPGLAWNNGYAPGCANRGVAHLVSRSLTLGY